METTDNQPVVQIEQLPFNVERKNNHLELTAKTPKNLSKKKLKEFEAKKITVELYLFDKEDIENLSKIEPIDYSQESNLTKIISSIKNKVTRIVLPDM